ncbi:MAG: hypothetical protein OIF32_00485 [Campylobacterales bacterium]|nr:hypothetical protein [Campylobacterales bacterium]
MKIKYLIAFLFAIILTGCVTTNNHGFGYQNNFKGKILPSKFSKVTKKYKSLSKEKVFAYGKVNGNVGHFVYGICSKGSTIEEAKQCALKACQQHIGEHMDIPNNQCKIYAINNKVIWK